MESAIVGKIALFFLRSMIWIYAFLPCKIQNAIVAGVAFILQIAKVRKNVIIENLNYAFPGDSKEQVQLRQQLEKKAYIHVARLIFDVLMVLGPMKRFVQKNTILKNFDMMKKARADGRGILLLSSHLGNWEIMGAAGGLTEALDVLIVTKKLKPLWLHEAIEKGRKACLVSGTYEPKTYKDILRFIKRGGTIGVVLDQYAGPPIGVRVPFFNQWVGTSTAIATIAKRTGAYVIPAYNFRNDAGVWTTVFEEPLEWIVDENLNREIALNTALYTQVVERHIRLYPEQWLWTHRRFKGDLSPLREGEWDQARPRTG